MKNWSLVVVMLALVLGACSSDPDRPRPRGNPNIDDSRDPLKDRRKAIEEARLDAEALYRRGRSNLNTSDWGVAIESYDSLSTRFPFSDFATQGELERVYALYRNFEPDRAVSSADRFLREHPRHPEVDYIYYIKGLINFNRDDSGLNILPSDDTKSDVTSQRRAFDDFALLLQKFPNSRYNGDAYERMVFIRNKLAAHELHVVDFYVRRGAYVAAAKRAEQVMAQYPGAPATYRALELLIKSYELAGLEQQAADARAIRDAQDKSVIAEDKIKEAAAITPAPATLLLAAADVAPPEKPGLMSRIAAVFSPLDSSEGGVEIVIPSSKTKAQESAPAASTAPAADTSAAATTSKSTGEKRSNKLEVFFEPYDSQEATTVKLETATPSSASP
ncbi:MAG: outer membrane protein assembly factor BamD [Panacagrimonas sp.]